MSVVAEAVLICALSLPASHFTRPTIGPWQLMKDEIERLKDFIHRNDPDAEIFIHPEPQEEKLKEDGWERVPFTWKGNKIWIKRQPKKNQINRTLLSA